MKKTYRAFSAGELSYDVYGRYDVDKYGMGCRTVFNMILMAQGGAFFRPGTKYSGQAGKPTTKVRLIPFEYSTVQAYDLEFGDGYMRVYKDGAQVLEATKAITGITQAAQGVVTANAHGYANGNEAFLTGIGGMTQLNGRNVLISDVTTNTFKMKDILTGAYIDTSAYTAYTAGGTAARVYQIASPYGQNDLFGIYFAQTADVMTLVHPSYAPRELTRSGHAAWSFSTPTFAPSIAAPTAPTSSWTGGAATTARNYVITAIKDESLEESLPSAITTVNTEADAAWNGDGSEYVTVGWTAAAGAVKYNIYKEKSGTYGFIGSSESTSFRDDKITPNVSITPPRARTPFNAPNKYPSVVTFQQQRRVFAGTNELPDTIFMSRAGMYSNLSVSIPSLSSDAITFALASGKVNKINHILPFKDMLVMTKGSEWRVSAGGGAYTPTTIKADPETEYGSNTVKPITIGNTAIFVAKYSRSIRDYNYTFDSDGYDGNDISVLSKHLIEKRSIVDWAYASEPDKLIWAVMSDGKLCTLTYMKEHRVWGWARHELGGDAFVESVCVIPDEINRRDKVSYVVKRTINGVTTRYIETLSDYVDDPVEDAYFLDCGLSYMGTAVNTVRGLWHLVGETVGVVSNGNVMPDQVVSAEGTISLPNAQTGTKIHVGKRYNGDLWPMPAETDGGQDGSTKQDPKRIRNYYAEVIRTRGLKGGQTPDDTVLGELFPVFAQNDLANSINTYTGPVQFAVQSAWDKQGVSPFMRQTYPLPAKIITITPVFQL